MTFPIAVGTGPRHSSSRPFPHAMSRGLAHKGESSDDSEVQDHGVVMAMGTNDDETLTATMFISYHFIISVPGAVASASKTADPYDIESRGQFDAGGDSENNHPSSCEMGELNGHVTENLSSVESIDTQFHVIAELRVQITPTTSPLVSNTDAMSSRETKCRVPLGTMRKRRRTTPRCATYTPNASIEFSSNNAHLACLIPLPIGYELVSSSEYDHGAVILPSHGKKYAPISTIVLFHIQTKAISSQQQLQRRKNLHLPAMPDYIVESTIGGDRTENELETDSTKLVDNVDTNEMSSHQTVSSSRGCVMSYVAHGPRIVRELGPDWGKRNVATSNRLLFFRKLSRGSSDSGPIPQPTLKCATSMCNVPSDHHRGKSSSASSLLLVGTLDGGILLVDFSLARARSVVLESVASNPTEHLKDGELHCRTEKSSHNEKQNHQSEQMIINRQVVQDSEYFCNPIIHVSQIAPTQWKPLDIYGEEQGSQSKGRVSTVLRDGSVNIYTTSFEAPSVFHADSLSDDRLQNGDDLSNCSDLIRGERKNWTKHTGLEMRINLLATYHTSKLGLDASLSRLRYARARWISPFVLSLLTRSSYLDDNFLLGRCLNTSVIQSEMVVAQVWCVAEVMQLDQVNQKEYIGPDVGWEVNAGANIVLASELKIPCGDSLNELIHDTFSLSRGTFAPLDGSHCKDSRSDFERMLVFAESSRCMSIFYHRSTDCLAINSQVVTCSSSSTGFALRVRPFCLIWDWKRNAPGLTLATCESYPLYQHDVDADTHNMHSLYSWFQLGDDENDGLCAIHVYEHILCRKNRRAVKNIFSLSTLSPKNRCSTEGCLSVNEPSAVLLHSDSVTFPLLGRPTNTFDVSLKWEESRVPSTYVSTNGPCNIAAVGKDYGRSIAVAASRGLCVLDLSRMPQIESGRSDSPPQFPRWKLFSNVNDEHRFRVVSMIWWECDNDDFLLAVVQYATIGTLQLVCWSRKNIGFGSQLLTESTAKEGDGSDGASDCGVSLPPGFRVHSMSLIRDPIDALPSGRSTLSNRALLLLAYISCDEGASCCVNYALYQLQAISPQLVLTRKTAHGSIPMQLGTSPDFSAAESVNGVFLAGGSFLFDLDEEVGEPAPYDVIAVIGIMTIFQGLVAVCVNQTEPILYRPSLLGNARESRNLIVSYWMSCMISSKYGSRIAWNIVQNDGNVYCWSVPCRNAESLHQSLNEHRNERSDVLPGLEKHSILGEICSLGSSTFWVNGATTSEREIAIGPFCPLSYPSTLYAGQRSRINSSISDPAATNSFHVTNCSVASPPLTPFLFVLFLTLSSSDYDYERQLVDCSGQGNPDNMCSESNHELVIQTYIKSTIRQQVHGLGSTSSVLRLIILKVVDLLYDSRTVSDVCVGSEIPDYTSNDTMLLLQKWKVGKAILSEIVAVVNELYDALGFATFFLSVGRQLEPHQFDLIFPLPAISLAPNSPLMHTAEDLFSLSCDYGSLATAVSALPLFSSHTESVCMVTELIYHCLIKIEENFQSCSSYTAITSGEDESYLHQLFWFGVKLEDAIEIEKSYEEEMEEAGSILACESKEDALSFDSSQCSIDSTSTADDDYMLDTSSSEESHNVSFLSPCQSRHRKPRNGLVKRVTQRLFPSSGSTIIPDSLNEDAVKEAASLFILSGFNDPPIESLPVQHNSHVTPVIKLVDGKASSSKGSSPYGVFPSVAGAVCLFIGRAIFDETDNENGENFGWKAVSAVAHLLQGDRETVAITSASMENAKRISRMLSTKDIMSFTAASDRECAKEESSIFMSGILVNLTSSCRRQIHPELFGTVFNLILLLLLRYDVCHDVQLSRTTLITVAVVSGHLSGRIDELLDLSEPCDVNDIYSVYADLVSPNK